LSIAKLVDFEGAARLVGRSGAGQPGGLRLIELALGDSRIQGGQLASLPETLASLIERRLRDESAPLDSPAGEQGEVRRDADRPVLSGLAKIRKEGIREVQSLVTGDDRNRWDPLGFCRFEQSLLCDHGLLELTHGS